jgi:malonate decarboxylase epsilon subunit
MTLQSAFLFPGQGAQTPGFLHALPEHEAVRATYRTAHEALELNPADMDSGAVLHSTVAVQLGVLIAGVAYVRVLAAKGVFPDAVAGLSVGAFTAAVASGALDFEAALQLVRVRAQAMEEAYGRGGYGMMAVLGLREAAVQQLIAEIARPDEPVYLASVNSPAEIIVAGSDPGLAAASEAAARAGARARRLLVNVPSHCALLDGVSMRLREAMREVRLDPPRVPYIGNLRARVLTNTADIAEDLVLNVSRTVRWHESVTLLYELGVRVFVEAPPGQALSNLVKSEFPRARALAAAAVHLDSIIHAVRQQTGS